MFYELNVVHYMEMETSNLVSIMAIDLLKIWCMELLGDLSKTLC